MAAPCASPAAGSIGNILFWGPRCRTITHPTSPWACASDILFTAQEPKTTVAKKLKFWVVFRRHCFAHYRLPPRLSFAKPGLARPPEVDARRLAGQQKSAKVCHRCAHGAPFAPPERDQACQNPPQNEKQHKCSRPKLFSGGLGDHVHSNTQMTQARHEYCKNKAHLPYPSVASRIIRFWGPNLYLEKFGKVPEQPIWWN